MKLFIENYNDKLLIIWILEMIIDLYYKWFKTMGILLACMLKLLIWSTAIVRAITPLAIFVTIWQWLCQLQRKYMYVDFVHLGPTVNLICCHCSLLWRNGIKCSDLKANSQLTIWFINSFLNYKGREGEGRNSKNRLCIYLLKMLSCIYLYHVLLYPIKSIILIVSIS